MPHSFQPAEPALVSAWTRFQAETSRDVCGKKSTEVKKLKVFNKFEEGLSFVFKLITAVALFVQMFIVFLGVIMRYCFSSPQPWIDELSAYLLVVITYLGGYVALRGDKMAGITFLRDSLPPKARRALCILGDLMIMVLLAAIAWYGYVLCSSTTVLNQRTPTLRIPIIVFYCLIPISGALMELSMVNRLIAHIRGKDIAVEEKGAYTE